MKYFYFDTGHDNPDQNSFTLYARESSLLDDGLYEKPKSTANHNTILVEGKGQLGEGRSWFSPPNMEFLTQDRTGKILFFSGADTHVEVVGDASRCYPPELGLTTTSESRLSGQTKNPWHLERVAGGSSGGAAAAVAAGIVPAAHATDGGGSIRVPASCCGVFGLKPTRGRTPMGPEFGESWSGMSAQHVVSRSVRDSAALLDATHGPDAGAPYAAQPPARPFLAELEARPGRLRIALQTETCREGE